MATISKAEKEIDKHMKECRIHKRAMKKIIDIADQWFNKLPNLPVQKDLLSIDAILEEIADSKDEFIDANNEIIHLCSEIADSDKANKLEEERLNEADSIRQSCWEAKGKLLEIKCKASPTETAIDRKSIASSTLNASFTAGTAVAARVKLPDIPIPKFDGNPRNFLDFRNLFESVIHNDESLTPIQKFYFLRGSLVGEAVSFLKGVNIAGDQYETIWKEFCDEFGKKRLIISAHLSDLFNASPIKQESGIRELLNTIDVAVRGLKQCGEQTDSWSVLLSYLLSSKLDNKTKTDFENSLTTNDKYPPYKKLREFLNIRAANSTRRELDKLTADRKPIEKRSSNQISVALPKCCICKAEHLLINCPEFAKKTPSERYEAVRNANRCTNCFNSNHKAADCRRSGCSKCGGKHHQLLHVDKTENSTNLAEKSSNVIVSPTSCSIVSCDETVVLPTAVVTVHCGDFVGSARILLDPASQPTLVSKSFVQTYNLPITPSKVGTSIAGIGGSVTASHTCQMELKSRFGALSSLSIAAEVVPASSFSYRITSLRIDTVVDKLKLLTLADPAFTKPVVDIPSIDMIIGAEYYMKILGRSPKTKSVDGVDLLLSIFGWVVIGKVRSKP